MRCDDPLTMGLAVGASVGVAVGACLQRGLHECRGGEAYSALARRSVRNEIFTELAKEAGMSSDITETIEYILQKARKLVKCERSSLFLVDKEHDDLVSLALSGQSEDTWFRVPKQKGIAGHVATHAAPLNVPDAYECPHFTSEFDQTTGFRTQSVLCLPIMSHEKMGGNGQREVIGVVQLLNKQGDTGHERFTEEDESDLREMTLLASVFLWNSSLTKFNRWAEAESSALLRTMAHLSGPPSSNALRPSVPHIHDEVVELQKVGSGVVLSSLKPNKEEIRRLRSISDFDVLAYHNSAAARDLLIPLSVQMWEDLGFISKFAFSAETLTNLFVALRTSYRNVPYHNFAHSFDVAHAVFGFLTKGNLASIFTDEEQLSLVLAAMFHDADHAGLNNQFHVKSKHPSSILLETTSSEVSSVLEIHHCNVAIQVLTDLAVLDHMDEAVVQNVWRDMISCILATDMKEHGNYLAEAHKLAEAGGASADSVRTNKLLLMQLLLKYADISNLGKPFTNAEKWSALVQEEFYCQGDKERRMGLDVAPMFDRLVEATAETKAVEFLQYVALPYFKVIAEIFPSCSYIYEQALENERTWSAAAANAPAS